MAITGSQPAITPARSGLLRSGAGRSGWPITVGRKVLLYALSGIARSDATRSNYTSPRAFVDLGGSVAGGDAGAGARVLMESLTITDRLDHEPATAAFRVQGGLVPPIGQSIIVTMGSQNTLDRVFAGHVLSTNLTHVTSDRRHTVVDVRAIDWTWGLTQRLTARRWYGTSATVIAGELLAAGAPGYLPTYVAAGLPVLDEFTITHVDTPSALSQLAKRIGGYWYIDYHKRLHLYIDADPEPVTPPQPMTPIHATLQDLQIDRDGSQLVTRVYVEGGGATALTGIPPGETILPVAAASWYEAAGGTVVSGPQRIRYGGVALGGGGSLVGPGAAPAAAPVALATAGLGIEAGTHEYAIAFLTAGGESLAGPRVAVTVGAVSAPPLPLVVGQVRPGAGPDPGAHQWAVTFVTPDGETVIGPAAALTLAPGPQPLAAPTPSPPGFGGTIEPGSFQYAITFQTASGESTPGPLSAIVTLTLASPAPVPTSPPVPGPPGVGGAMELGAFAYVMTFENAIGESTTGPGAGATLASSPIAPPPAPSGSVTLGNLPVAAYRYGVTFVTANGGETTLSELSALVPLLPNDLRGIRVTVPVGGATVTARRLYRWLDPGFAPDGHGPLLVVSIGDNATTVFDDVGFSVSTPPPSTNTSAGPLPTAIPLTVPTGPAGQGITARHLYRANSTGVYRRVTTFANNSTTNYTDTASSASIAGNPTLPTGALQNLIPLTLPTAPSGQGVTSRHVYRSKHGGALAKLTTIANNSTTSYTDTTPTAALGAAPPTVNQAGAAQVDLLQLPLGGPDVTARRIYRTAAGGVAYGLVLTVADNVTVTATDTVRDSVLGVAPPAVTTALAHRVQLAAIQIGPAGTTARRIYRTANDAAILRVLATLADNVATTYLDAAADATLGAAAPLEDTSGLTQPAGIVRAGAVLVPVAGAGGFPATGWAVIGNGQQVIRYTGVSASTLTGVPPTGPGAVTATIAYNSTITAAPQLTGIPASGDGAIQYGIPEGADVNLWITVDDTIAQAAIAALFTSAAAGAHSGVIEDVIQDRRLAAPECRARGRAHLAQRKELLIRIRYTSHDRNTRAGRLVTVNLLGAPYVLSATFRIQTVTVRRFLPTLPPTCEVEASSVTFSFEDLLRRLRDRGPAGLPTGG